MIANGKASPTNRPKDMLTSFLCMMVTATSVEAEPMGVRFPPRLHPNTTAHHRGSVDAVPWAWRIFESIAASGMLSVTELAAADETRIDPVPAP